MHIIDELKAIINEYNLLNHPFYQAWSQGTLSIDVLKDYAIQYYQQVASFPRFITRVHTHCDDITWLGYKVRQTLVHNLVDEEIHGKDHPSLWMQFALGMGASDHEVKNATPYAETAALVNQFYQLAESNWRDGLCALFAYESQVPEVAASKIAGLKEHYGITDDATLEFFIAHQAYDVEHAADVADLIASAITDKKAAYEATRAAARAQWQFLDGLCEKHHIVCH